jgi:hypothetical protein
VFGAIAIKLVSKPSLLLWHQEREEDKGLKVKVTAGGRECRFLDSSVTDLGT